MKFTSDMVMADVQNAIYALTNLKSELEKIMKPGGAS